MDDLMKMLKHCLESNYFYKFHYLDTKNLSFCKSIEGRLQKQMKKLREEGKI
jgi:hypothetical protein